MSGTGTAAANELSALVDRLNQRIAQLEDRVSSLEARPAEAAPRPKPVAPATAPTPAETWAGFPSPHMPSAVPVIGKAVLGMAGAYLFRALAEAPSLPKLPILLAAIAYAAWWMLLAIRSREHGFASVTFATTSVLILSPMLWETTVRFRYLSPAFTGSILLAFFVATLLQSRRHSLQAIPAVATLATCITALGLILTTHEVAPLAAALLAIAAATEIFACLDYKLSFRLVPALAADLAICLLVYLSTNPGGTPEGYSSPSMTVVMLLWLGLAELYIASIAYRGFWRMQPITALDIVQSTLAFIPAAVYALRGPHSTVVTVLGGCFLFLAACCYWGALSRFAAGSDTRNRRISAIWAAILAVAGTIWFFAAIVQVPILCVAALAATYIYTRNGKLSLGLHASVFIAAASAVSQLHSFVLNALTGDAPTPATWGIWLTAITAAACYGIASHSPEDHPRRRALWVLPAAVLGFTSAALVVSVGHRLFAAQYAATASGLSVLRTLAICMLALVFSFLGLQRRRAELTWLGYATIAIGTLKLILEDLRYGNAASLVLSLLVYGLILIVLPRLARRAEHS